MLSETEILSRLVYRDAMMLIIDKPPGMPVHPGSGGGVTLQHHFQYLRFGLPQDPALAHRLDRETSGCLVLGRHKQALKKLGELFAQNAISKTYWAIVEGTPPQNEGTIDLALGPQSERKNSWRMQPDTNGQRAITHYRVLGTAGALSWLELKPETGRTHQLRVHCAAMGFPILGDRAYGHALQAQNASPLHLHARAVSIPLYPKKSPVSVSANPPPAFTATLKNSFNIEMLQS